jgi:tetratricopeptide (TPR) repeat protein
VQIVVELLSGTGLAPSLIDTALLALEHREFQRVIEELAPRARELDDRALVALALAFDAVGRQTDAITMLEKHYKGGTPSTDVMGVLAGRYKKKWLAARRRIDWERGRELYYSALDASDPQVAAPGVTPDFDQAMYHAINVAFLDLLETPERSTVPEHVATMARRALGYAEHAANNHWGSATCGDANAILGDLDQACRFYTEARQAAPQPREIDSMYAQAVRIAAHIYGSGGVQRVESCFTITSGH